MPRAGNMTVPIYQVDAFTSRRFAGNPAAVCVLDGPGDEAWMQDVAAEMNLSETAFLSAGEDGWSLRWFTPVVEVSLCGHATLASAHVLWETQRLGPAESARFHTRSGLLTAERRGEWIEMDFPAHEYRLAEAPVRLAEALGARPVAVATVAGATGETWLVEFDGEATVRRLRPDFRRLRQVPGGCAIVTAVGGGEYDFVSRFFAPGAGIDEDPVTGSSHCSLGPYWADRLGKTELVARQVSRRGGVVKVRLGGERVILGGQAVTVMEGGLV